MMMTSEREIIMIGIGSDHAAFKLKQDVMHYLDEKGIEYKDYGTYSEDRCNYPEYGYIVAKAVADGECEKGIVLCGTGVGISLAANKVKGIRCVVCSEPYSALLSRQHNDTNMLAMGARVIGTGEALLILETWLNGTYEGGRHQVRIDEISSIETMGRPIE